MYINYISYVHLLIICHLYIHQFNIICTLIIYHMYINYISYVHSLIICHLYIHQFNIICTLI